jgi:hypothetical protein
MGKMKSINKFIINPSTNVIVPDYNKEGNIPMLVKLVLT